MAKNTKAKGGSFERLVCKQLSLWWSGKEQRDDIFWRSTSSGARATSRAAQGKKTANSAGDVCYLCDEGKALLEAFSIELKRGYASLAVQRVLDRETGSKPSLLEEWIAQAEKSMKDSGSKSWLLITKKDRAKPLVFLPFVNYCFCIDHTIKVPYLLLADFCNIDNIVCMTLANFFATVSPDKVKKFAEMEFEDYAQAS
jgi:hypothetical protein